MPSAGNGSASVPRAFGQKHGQATMPSIFRVRARQRHHISARAMRNPCFGTDNLIAGVGFLRPCRQTAKSEPVLGSVKTAVGNKLPSAITGRYFCFAPPCRFAKSTHRQYRCVCPKNQRRYSRATILPRPRTWLVCPAPNRHSFQEWSGRTRRARPILQSAAAG